MQNFYNDLEQLQEAYDKTFSNQGMFKLTYQGYLKRCKERNVPKSAIMTKDEWEAMQSGDMDPMAEVRDPENGYKPDSHKSIKI
jgi:hypothetical protein